jgi:hypothetical protein
VLQHEVVGRRVAPAHDLVTLIPNLSRRARFGNARTENVPDCPPWLQDAGLGSGVLHQERQPALT